MKKDDINISDSEIIVMKVIWSKGFATSREVIETITKATSWKPTTIKTMLTRLVEKNALRVEKQGNKNYYYPISSQNLTYESFFDDAVYKVCNKSVGDMIVYLLSSNELSSDDLNNIKIALENKNANDNLKCNCIEKFGVCNCRDCSKN